MNIVGHCTKGWFSLSIGGSAVPKIRWDFPDFFRVDGRWIELLFEYVDNEFGDREM